MPSLTLPEQRLSVFWKKMVIQIGFPGRTLSPCLEAVHPAPARITYKSKSMSGMPHQSSLITLQQMQEAAAEVAATEEIIKIMKTQHQREEDIKELEVEDAWKKSSISNRVHHNKDKVRIKEKRSGNIKRAVKTQCSTSKIKGLC